MERFSIAQGKFADTSERTMSRMSIRYSAPVGESGVGSLEDRSARHAVETMKGISRDSTPSSIRSL